MKKGTAVIGAWRAALTCTMRGVAAVMLTFAAFVTASAQKEQGDVYLLPRVGVNGSWLKGQEIIVGMDEAGGRVCESGARLGLTAGCEAEYMVHRALGLRTGLLYSMQGDRLKACGDMGDLKTTLGYLCVPLTATLYVSDGLGFTAGLQYSRMVHSGVSDATGTDIGWSFKKNDISIPVALSVENGRIMCEVRYVLGLADVDNLSVGGNSVKNRSLWVTLGYRVDL